MGWMHLVIFTQIIHSYINTTQDERYSQHFSESIGF